MFPTSARSTDAARRNHSARASASSTRSLWPADVASWLKNLTRSSSPGTTRSSHSARRALAKAALPADRATSPAIFAGTGTASFDACSTPAPTAALSSLADVASAQVGSRHFFAYWPSRLQLMLSMASLQTPSGTQSLTLGGMATSNWQRAQSKTMRACSAAPGSRSRCSVAAPAEAPAPMFQTKLATVGLRDG